MGRLRLNPLAPNGLSLDGDLTQIAVNNASSFSLSAHTTDELPQGSTNLYSQWANNSPGIRYTGHIAVGADAVVNGTGPVNDFFQDNYGTQTAKEVLNVQEVHTGTAAFYEHGLNVKQVANYTGNATLFVGANITAATATGYTGNVTLASAILPTVIHRGTGIINASYANTAAIWNQSTGTINVAATMVAQVLNGVGGTITDARTIDAIAPQNSGTMTSVYGLYLEDHSGIGGTASYNLYSLGSTSRNYMGGKLGIGTGDTHATFGTNHRLIVGVASTLDNAARVQLNSEAITDHPLVVQGFAGQTANLTEWQSSAAAPLAYIDSAGLGGFAGLNITDAKNIVLGSTTGTKIGTATTQKLGFYNATPVVQPGATTDLGVVLSNLGLRAAGTAYPITTSGTATLTGGIINNYVAKTGTYAIATSDYLINCTANTFTVTLPTAVGVTGQTYVIKNSGTGVITIATTSSQTIDGVTTATLSTQYSSITVMSNGANWIII